MANLNFSQEEVNLIFIYNSGVRQWLIDDLKGMVTWLSDEEADLRSLAESVVDKLSAMSDKEFAASSDKLVPDFFKEED